jgi:hypothetical protein
MLRFVVLFALVLSSLFVAPPAKAQMYSMSTCVAQTICRPGTPFAYPISCYATANAFAGAACSWFTINATYVECVGLNAYGVWGKVFYYCR